VLTQIGGYQQLVKCILERTEKLLKSVENKFRDSHAVGYFVVSEKRDDLSVRQKDWFDNAMPAGNSMLLQAYAQLEAVTQNFSSSSCFHDLSQAYRRYKNVPAIRKWFKSTG
jgi:uncharacterized protein YyaL (SSP411 family)